MTDLTKKTIKFVEPFSLYKWAKNFARIQNRFYANQYKLRRIQQIEDFINLNNFQKVHHIEEVRIDLELPKTLFTSDINVADFVLHGDRKTAIPAEAYATEQTATTEPGSSPF